MTVPTFVDPDDEDLIDPIPFRLDYRNADGDRDVAEFTALPAIPYVYILDFFASGTGDVVEQSAAHLLWFDRVLTPEDRQRFSVLVHDPAVRVKAATLRDIASWLLERYQTPDPTRARSAGQKRSRNGSTPTKRGSAARSRVKGSTSS